MKKEKFLLLLRYIKGVFFFFGLPALLFIVAGTTRWWQGWVYIAIAYGASIISRAILAKVHPDLVQERVNYSEKKDVKPWDKILMPLVALVFPAAYFITAGLDKRFAWSNDLPLWLYLLALIITLAAYAFSTWALVTNRFFSAVVRIQTDRGHSVVENGPYRYVRHPGYAAAVWVALMFPIMMTAWWAYIPAGLMVVAIVIRTALEDKTLQAELPGYAQYAFNTKYRLLPGIW